MKSCLVFIGFLIDDLSSSRIHSSCSLIPCKNQRKYSGMFLLFMAWKLVISFLRQVDFCLWDSTYVSTSAGFLNHQQYLRQSPTKNMRGEGNFFWFNTAPTTVRWFYSYESVKKFTVGHTVLALCHVWNQKTWVTVSKFEWSLTNHLVGSWKTWKKGGG